MYTSEQLSRAISDLDQRPLTGNFYRVINLRHAHSPLSAIGSMRGGGRFTPRGEFEAFYTSLDPATGFLEAQQIDPGVRIPHPPSLTLSIGVVLSRVIDLSQVTSYDLIGSSLQEMMGPWRPMQNLGLLAPTQILGQTIFNDTQIEAFLVESSRAPGQQNLVILPDRLDHRSTVTLYDPHGSFEAVQITPQPFRRGQHG
jgi:RES domain-containing protein